MTLVTFVLVGFWRNQLTKPCQVNLRWAKITRVESESLSDPISLRQKLWFLGFDFSWERGNLGQSLLTPIKKVDIGKPLDVL